MIFSMLILASFFFAMWSLFVHFYLGFRLQLRTRKWTNDDLQYVYTNLLFLCHVVTIRSHKVLTAETRKVQILPKILGFQSNDHSIKDSVQTPLLLSKERKHLGLWKARVSIWTNFITCVVASLLLFCCRNLCTLDTCANNEESRLENDFHKKYGDAEIEEEKNCGERNTEGEEANENRLKNDNEKDRVIVQLKD